jgi:hypothetical protein
LARRGCTHSFAESMKALRAYVRSYPGMLLLAFYATWLAGRVSLGHWPRPSLDDPKFIGAWVDVPYTITGLLLVVGLPAFAIAFLALLYVAYCDEARRKRLLLVSAISIVCMVATILVLRWDALGVVAWYMD